MKKRFMFLFVAMIACLYSVTGISFAVSTLASDQINTYEIRVVPVTGKIDVDILVSGKGVMEKIGCESIYIYEKVGTRWTLAESLNENDDGMCEFNRMGYINTISCDGEKGVEYRVEVTIFAENSNGRDTRSKTVYVTGK